MIPTALSIAAAGGEDFLALMKKANVLPIPASDATPIWPFWSSVSSRDMNKPRPLPPYWTCVRGLAWENRLNNIFFSSVLKPLPVS